MELSTIILIVVFGLLAIYLIVAHIRDHKKKNAAMAAIRADSEQARDNSIELDYHQTYSIAGINLRGLDPLRDCGAFHGYVARDLNNQYDRHAIAVFKGTKQHVGYLRADDAAYLSKDLDEIGGKCPCVLEIRATLDDDGRRFLIGKVQLLWPDTE